MGTLVIALAGSSAMLLVAPTWYWAAGDARPAGWRVDSLGEAFLAVPVGAVGLVLSAYLCVWFGAAWRGMARALLGRQGSPVSTQPPPIPIHVADCSAWPRTRCRARGTRQLAEIELKGPFPGSSAPLL